jgi:hemerythrin
MPGQLAKDDHKAIVNLANPDLSQKTENVLQKKKLQGLLCRLFHSNEGNAFSQK